jgi:hypothetical protein
MGEYTCREVENDAAIVKQLLELGGGGTIV